MLHMPDCSILAYKGHRPKLGKNVFIAAGARLIGDLEAGNDVSFWFNVVVRGDVNHIRIGPRTNVQDNTVIHVEHDTAPTLIGADVTIGHSAVIHGCTIEDQCLIGMGAIIMNHVRIGRGSLVAAGALLPQGREYPPGSLIKGTPATVARPLTPAEQAELAASAKRYVGYARDYINQGA